MPRVIPRGNILQSVQSEAQSVAIPSAISKISSAANTAATAIPDISAIEALLPKNCSLGTKQFCVGYDDHTDCNNLPLNVSSIIPEAVASFVSGQVQALQPLEGILTKITAANIQDSLILGLVLVVIMAAAFVSSIAGQLFCIASCLLPLGNKTRVIICLASGVVCCLFFLIPVVTLRYVVQPEIQKLQAIIDVEKGDVSRYYLGAFLCAVYMMLVATIAPALT